MYANIQCHAPAYDRNSKAMYSRVDCGFIYSFFNAASYLHLVLALDEPPSFLFSHSFIYSARSGLLFLYTFVFIASKSGFSVFFHLHL